MFKRFLLIIAFLIAVASQAQSEPLTIGLLTELSGTYSANGADIKLGYELARKVFAPNDLVGAQLIRFVYADSQGEGKIGVTEYRRLVEIEKAIAVCINRGPVVSAVNPIASQMKIPTLGVNGVTNFITDNPYAFRFWPSPRVEGEAYAKEFLRRGLNRVALITVQDDYLLSVSAGFKEAFKKGNGEIIIDDEELETNKDFLGLISKIKIKKPEAIFVNLGISQVPLFLNKLKSLGYQGQVATNVFIAKSSIFSQIENRASENVFFVEPSLRHSPEFKRIAKDLMQKENVTTASYASFMSLGTLLKVIAQNQQKLSTPDDVYQALSATKSMKLLDVEFAIINREAQFDMEVKTIRNGAPE